MLSNLIYLKTLRYWLITWCLISALGSVILAQQELTKLRETFETDARIVHRLLSQRAVQHEAVLATLALLQPPSDSANVVEKLPALYPQILEVQQRESGVAWTDPKLTAAEVTSRKTGRAALAEADFQNERYMLVLSAQPSSFALLMDIRAVVPWGEWPMSPQNSPVRVTIEHEGQIFAIQPGRIGSGGWQYSFHKHLAADSQPFDVVAVRQVEWIELPWFLILGWLAFVAISLAGLFFLVVQRKQRQRAEELLRLGQIARLNALGELAAGMAHELNQPLTAVLANSQAAIRLLSDNPPEIPIALDAMIQAAEQARRASSVVSRLRRIVERPNETKPLEIVLLKEAVTNALHLLEPELLSRNIKTQFTYIEEPVTVLAEPIAMEQIIHNLMMNAIQALEQVDSGDRHLKLNIQSAQGHGVLTIADSGLGIASDVLPRVFEPFFSTRNDGLGLGLSLCESLANRMGGQLSARAHDPRGASFCLRLPLEQK